MYSVYFVLISILWPFCSVLLGKNLFTSALSASVLRSFVLFLLLVFVFYIF